MDKRMVKLRVSVPGVSCEAIAVEKAIQKVPGIHSVYVNPAVAQAFIECDSAPNIIDQVVDTVRDRGFDAEPVLQS